MQQQQQQTPEPLLAFKLIITICLLLTEVIINMPISFSLLSVRGMSD